MRSTCVTSAAGVMMWSLNTTCYQQRCLFFLLLLCEKKCDFLSSVVKGRCHSFLQMLLKLQIQLCQILTEKNDSNSYIRFDFRTHLCQHVSDIMQLCFLTFWIWASFVGHKQKKKKKKKEKKGGGEMFCKMIQIIGKRMIVLATSM